jgi:hypothetical protein
VWRVIVPPCPSPSSPPPLVSVLLVGREWTAGLVSVLIALVTVGVVLFVAVRFGKGISRAISHESDEIILLSTFGLVLLVAGLAQGPQVSAAVGAFLVGIAVSGPLAGQGQPLWAAGAGYPPESMTMLSSPLSATTMSALPSPFRS